MSSAKTRVALWDNARFALIVLVVIGHLISTVRTDTELGFGLYAYIYLFHMPAMIALSGLFSKPEVTPKAVTSTIQLLVVWLAWEGIWALLRGVVEGKQLSQGFLVSPAWTLWFLVTLVTMRILLPFIARFKHPLLLATALALIAPLLPAIGVHFSAARTLAFLPFFVGAYLAKERGWLTGEWFMAPSAKIRAAAWALLAGVAGALAATAFLPGGIKGFWRIDRWLTHRDSYAWMFDKAPIGGWDANGEGVLGWAGLAAGGILVGAVLIAVATAMTLALLLVVSRKQSIFTVWGARTLYVYLLHGVIVWALRESGAVAAVGSLGWGGVVLLSLIAASIAAVLSMKWVSVLFRPIVEPRIDWLFKPAEASAPAAPRPQP
ncbi:acyltransferase family protein [Leucobacter komagatae]|uniref:acyltransferase family protein n=1 Tax=Leucobacter komagatae TaxID=55969 RepID=UPI000A713E70|nr:acyltransferase family protein [Leucobacter komagatae]